MMDRMKIADEGLSKKELERLFSMAECALMIVKPGAELELLYANKKFYNILQCKPKEFEEKYGNQLMAVVLPEEKQKIRALVARQSAAGGALQLEFRLQRMDGTTAWLSMSARNAVVDGELVHYCSCIDVTQSKRSVESVFRAKRELDVIANSIPGGMIKMRVKDRKILYANDGYFLLSGYSRIEYNENFDDKALSCVHQLDLDMVNSSVKTAAESGGLLGFECRIIAKNGTTKWIYVNGRRVDDEEGEIVYLCVIMDITGRKQMEAEARDFARGADLLSDYRKESMWIYDMTTKEIYCNGGLGERLSSENIIKAIFDLNSMQKIMHPEDLENFLVAQTRRTTTLGSSRNSYRLQDDNGNYRTVELTTVSVSETGDDNPTKIYGLTRMSDQVVGDDKRQVLDISQKEHRLMNLAKISQSKSEDNLTGLLPYATFIKRAEEMLRNRKDKECMAVICADINEFHKFTHNYGFSVSNRILRSFSNILKSNIAKDGMCTRVDGDYFVMLYQYDNHKELLKAMSAVVRSQQQLDEEGSYPRYGTTCGVYLIQNEDEELTDMLGRADLARRSIKGLSGNHYAIYTEDLEEEKFHEREIVEEIIEAMNNHSIEICYLPRICNTRENVVGCKAVARVQLKSGEYIESDRLLRFVERGGKLDEFAFSILDTVCCNINAWQRKGYQTFPVSIEMTASELSIRNAVPMIDDIVRKQNWINPEQIVIEVQEKFFANMTTSFEMAVEELLRIGYRVVISRFGSDHTAIHTLRRLPVTGIKFHGEYFNDYRLQGKEQIVFKKIVETVKELGMKVACGGIHNKLQEDFAKEIGCDLLEGDIYYGAVRSNVFEKCFLEAKNEK